MSPESRISQFQPTCELLLPLWATTGMTWATISSSVLSSKLNTLPACLSVEVYPADESATLHCYRFTPVLDPTKLTDQWYAVSGGGGGELHIQVSYKPAAVRVLIVLHRLTAKCARN